MALILALLILLTNVCRYDNGFHGNKLIKTPFMDDLVAKDSLLLERHYVFKYCSPTRRSFLSGRVPPHSGEANGPDVTVDTRMHTIAAKMKSAGYGDNLVKTIC